MELMSRMNQKMVQGYKLTNITCNQCNGVTMATLTDQYKSLYCPKCNKKVQGKFEQQQSQQKMSSGKQQGDNGEDQYYEKIINETKHAKDSFDQVKQNPDSKYADAISIDPLNRQQSSDGFYYPQVIEKNNSNQISKKLGQKLIQGWTMLEQSCKECNVPLMKNKKGDKTCEGCGKNYALPPKSTQKKVQQQKIVSPIDSSTQCKKKQLIKNAPKPPHSKIQKTTQVNQQIDHVLFKVLQKIEASLDKQYETNGLKGIEHSIFLIQKIKSISNSK